MKRGKIKRTVNRILRIFGYHIKRLPRKKEKHLSSPKDIFLKDYIDEEMKP